MGSDAPPTLPLPPDGLAPLARLDETLLGEGLCLILAVGPDFRAAEGLRLIRARLPPSWRTRWHVLDVDGPDLSASLEAGPAGRAVLLVHGLEWMPPALRADTEVRLNLLRDKLADLDAVVVLWIPRSELRDFHRRCPDLHHWRSLLLELRDEDVPADEEEVERRRYLAALIRLAPPAPSRRHGVDKWEILWSTAAQMARDLIHGASGVPLPVLPRRDGDWPTLGLDFAQATIKLARSRGEPILYLMMRHATPHGGDAKAKPLNEASEEARPIDAVFSPDRARGTAASLPTFVEPAEMPRLLDALRIAGRVLVVCGPPGCGKASAVRAALDRLGVTDAGWLSWLDGDHIEKRRGFAGHLVVDAPAEIGLALIWNTVFSPGERGHLTLIIDDLRATSFDEDLVDVIEMGQQPDEKIDELIERGEEHANIRFLRREELIHAARGSLQQAQRLCLETARAAGIYHVQPSIVEIFGISWAPRISA